jgi:hypothetical protein
VAASVTHACRKDTKLLRTVLEEVVADEVSTERLELVLHWKGGVHTRVELVRPGRRGTQCNAEEDIAIIRKMAVRYGDRDIARVLNKLGGRTGKGMEWSENSVKSARCRAGISGRVRTVDDPQVLSFNAAARHLDVSNTTVKRLVDAGLLPMSQLVTFAPWELKRSDLDSAPVQELVAQLKKTGRLALPGVSSTNQQELFQQNQGGNNVR